MDRFRVVRSASEPESDWMIEWIQPDHPPVIIMRRFSTELEAQIWADQLAALHSTPARTD